MQLDKNEKMPIIDSILDTFLYTFGRDIVLLKKQIAIEHMGFFEIRFQYIPLEYELVFENDRGVFSIIIYDSEGAHNILYRIEKYNNQTTVENVKNATIILKNILEKNEFCFYIEKNGKLYKKEKHTYSRVKDMRELFTS